MLDRAAILKLIPHQGAMCLLDNVRHWDDRGIACDASSHSLPDNPLRRDGTLPALAAIEYGLQAAALHGALLAGTAEPARLLAALRDVRLRVPRIDTGETLRVQAVRQQRDGDALIYGFRIGAGDALLIEGYAFIAARRRAGTLAADTPPRVADRDGG
jgi:predicted hotdog family 3-hydroxylacyl-ACP dehydratase